MFWKSCTVDGTMDDSKFSKPMPWIGIYVALASLLCATGMALDAIHGFRYRKFWFLCKYFALNATTLTIIGISVKLSVDLNTSMPHRHDQLAKLSSTALICTSIGNFFPSLGAMETKEMMMNVVALGILVITVIANVCIQLVTGVIYEFWAEHVVMMLLMVVLFVNLICASFAVPATKSFLENKYKKKYAQAEEENNNKCGKPLTRKLQDSLMRYWMMAHTSHPQFVVARSATCTASGAFCLLSSITLAEAIARSYAIPRSFKFCGGRSDYKLSTSLILVTQAIAVVIGTIAPASRWFTATRFMCLKRPNKSTKADSLSVETYWTKQLNLMKVKPLGMIFLGRRGRKYAHKAKDSVLNLCIRMQKLIVIFSKSVRLTSALIGSWFTIMYHSFTKAVFLIRRNDAVLDIQNKSKNDSEVDLTQYVLHLQGEEDLICFMMDKDAPTHWITLGRKQQPKNLMKFLEKLNPLRGFKGVKEFDSNLIPSLHFQEPPNNWALPVVTLTSIAVAISNEDDFNFTKDLIKCVHEGLKYIRVIEAKINVKQDLDNIKKTAEAVWLGVDLSYKWFNLDLRKFKGKSPKDIISLLSGIAKEKFMEFGPEMTSFLREHPSKWPFNALAANSMYRTCETLLIMNDNITKESSMMMIERIQTIIADIIGACLTNIYQAILAICRESSIENRAESVRHAIVLLGMTERIIETLSFQPLPNFDPEEMACIDKWRALNRDKDRFICNSSANKHESPYGTSCNLNLNIDIEPMY